MRVAEDHLPDLVEDEELGERVGEEGLGADGEGRPVAAVAVPGDARRDARLEELLDEAALLLDAGDDLLHEVARERGDGEEEVGLDSLRLIGMLRRVAMPPPRESTK